MNVTRRLAFENKRSKGGIKVMESCHRESIFFKFNVIQNFVWNEKLARCRSMVFKDAEHRPQITFRVLPRIERRKVVCEAQDTSCLSFLSFSPPLSSLARTPSFYPLTASFLLSFYEPSSILLSVSGSIDRAAWEKAHGERGFCPRNRVLSKRSMPHLHISFT